MHEVLCIEYDLVGVAAVLICLEIMENRGVILVRRLSTRARRTGGNRGEQG
jgi:hypothetical protein